MRHDVEDGGGAAVLDRGQRQTGSGPSGSNPKDMQKRMEAAATPGPAHKALDALAGSWKADVTCWQDPNGTPEVSKATAKTSWILKGHFLEEEFHGEMMGKPFTGRSLLGFDNIKQEFNMVWISDMQTSMFLTRGKGEDNNKTITLEGKADCAATGQRDVPMRAVFRVHGPDKHTFEMYDESKGRNAKVMEITYTRA